MRRVHWLAGLLEGEGSFHIEQGKYPVVALAMSDHDIVCRVARMVRQRCRGPYTGTEDYYSPMYRVTVYGSKAKTLMHAIYPLMGERRREQIRNALQVEDEV